MCTQPLLKIRTNTINPDTGDYKLIWLSAKSQYLSLDELINKYGDNLIQIPCGHCQECLNNRKKELAVRAYYAFNDKETYFITLTFKDEKELKKAEENPKKYLLENYNEQLTEYIATWEHGEQTKRGHYHLITTNYSNNKKIWNKGYTDIKIATPETIFYTANYVEKKKNNNDIVFFSKGLGKKEVLQNIKKLKELNSITIKGIQYNIPRYFQKLINKNKSADEKRREQIEKCRAIRAYNKTKREQNDNYKGDEIAYKKATEEKLKRKEEEKHRNLVL